MMDYAEALRFLRGRIERDGHLVGVAAGSGITAKYAVAGGCDLVLALSSGKYRQMGCSSMAGFLCYANSNDLVMDYALRELMRPCAGVPLLFGLNASDPTRAMYDYIREIKRMGFTGVVNYPTAGMIDGRFRAALEAGRLEEANRLLGRPFAIDWTVEHGRKLGHKLGFPTANQHIGEEFARPRFGVYATRVLIDGVPYAAATNVGIKPTVGSDCVSAESYILDWSGDLYGRRIETQFLKFLRPEEKFETLEELRHAIGVDAERAREAVAAACAAGGCT